MLDKVLQNNNQNMFCGKDLIFYCFMHHFQNTDVIVSLKVFSQRISWFCFARQSALPLSYSSSAINSNQKRSLRKFIIDFLTSQCMFTMYFHHTYFPSPSLTHPYSCLAPFPNSSPPTVMSFVWCMCDPEFS